MYSNNKELNRSSTCFEDDSDLISRKTVIEDLMNIPSHFDSGDVRWGVQISIDQVRKIPSVDAVRITRCKNCEHSREWNDKTTLLCYRDRATIHIVNPESYCDKAERRKASDDVQLIDYSELPHGHWHDVYQMDDSTIHGVCSVCKKTTILPDGECTPYCCNCGARQGW